MEGNKKLYDVFNIDTIAEIVSNQARKTGLKISGPENIEYGFGWEPNISFWQGSRRIHYYWNFFGESNNGLTLEVAEIEAVPPVLLGIAITFNDLWQVFEIFFREQKGYQDLPDLNWREDKRDHNKFIPHPPDKADFKSGNIAALFKPEK